jgi:hypothetical protein
MPKTHTTEVRKLDVVQLMVNYRPGSYDENPHLLGEPWGWHDEVFDIRSRECACCGEKGHYQFLIEDKMLAQGEFWLRSVEIDHVKLGDDGRVWDGHHRIVGALTLGWPVITVEIW